MRREAKRCLFGAMAFAGLMTASAAAGMVTRLDWPEVALIAGIAFAIWGICEFMREGERR